MRAGQSKKRALVLMENFEAFLWFDTEKFYKILKGLMCSGEGEEFLNCKVFVHFEFYLIPSYFQLNFFVIYLQNNLPAYPRVSLILELLKFFVSAQKIIKKEPEVLLKPPLIFFFFIRNEPLLCKQTKKKSAFLWSPPTALADFKKTTTKAAHNNNILLSILTRDSQQQCMGQRLFIQISENKVERLTWKS